MTHRLLLALVALSILAGATARAGGGDILAASRALVYEDRFINAYLALGPLLRSDERSEAQEEALWLADRLCAYVATSGALYDRVDAEAPADLTWENGGEKALRIGSSAS